MQSATKLIISLYISLSAATVNAASPAYLTQTIKLKDTLNAAIEKAKLLQPSDYPAHTQSSDWLAALPSISLVYLNSQTSQGADEAEMNIKLPFKSPQQRNIDHTLHSLTAQISENQAKLRQLFFSGLIRESIWSYKIATLQYKKALEKQSILRQLEQRFIDLFEAKAEAKYGLLLVQQEILNSQMYALGFQQEADKWLNQYKQVTGLNALPDIIIEPGVSHQDLIVNQHPVIVGLDLAWRQHQAIMLANSPNSAPWNVSVTAKTIQTPGFTENQLGIGLDIPLSLINVSSQSQNSEWLLAKKQYEINRDNVLNGTKTAWTKLHKRAQHLTTKEQLLAKMLAVSEQINQHISTLQSHNAINQEIILRRMLDAVETQTAYSVNHLLQQQNQAMLRQAAGISL